MMADVIKWVLLSILAFVGMYMIGKMFTAGCLKSYSDWLQNKNSKNKEENKNE